MKKKNIRLFFTFCFLIPILFGSVTSFALSQKEIEDSTHKFITSFYNGMKSEDVSKISPYFLKKIDKKTLKIITCYECIMLSHRVPLSEEDIRTYFSSSAMINYKFKEISIASKRPLIVYVFLMITYNTFPTEMEMAFILKNIGGNEWKIIDYVNPGL